MQNTSLASKAPSSVFQEIGTVVAADDELMVQTASGRFSASCAVSCLLAPELDDEVLVAVPTSGPLWVLAVLARPTEAPLRLRLDTDASVECAGQLSLFAVDKLELRSPKEVQTTATRVSTVAVDATVATENLSIVARVVEANTEKIKGVLGMVDTVLERLSQRVKRSYRFVEEIDMTRAKEIDIRAEDTVHFRGRNAFMSAEDLVKMQAQQIHLG
jgi:hypothetical protein